MVFTFAPRLDPFDTKVYYRLGLMEPASRCDRRSLHRILRSLSEDCLAIPLECQSKFDVMPAFYLTTKGVEALLQSLEQQLL